MLLRTIKPNKDNHALLKERNEHQTVMVDIQQLYYARVVDKFKENDAFGKGVIPQSVGLLHLKDGDVLGVELEDYKKIIPIVEDACNSLLVSESGLSVVSTNIKNKMPQKEYLEDSRTVIIKDNDITSIRPTNSQYDGSAEYTLRFNNQTAQNGIISLPEDEATYLMNRCNPYTNGIKYIDVSSFLPDMIQDMGDILNTMVKLNTMASISRDHNLTEHIVKIGEHFDSIIKFTINKGCDVRKNVSSFYTKALSVFVENINNMSIFDKVGSLSVTQTELSGLTTLANRCIEMYAFFGRLTRYTQKTTSVVFRQNVIECADEKYIKDNCGFDSIDELYKSSCVVSEDEIQSVVLAKIDTFKELNIVATIVSNIISYYGCRRCTDYRNTNITIPLSYSKLGKDIYNKIVKCEDFTINTYNYIIENIAKTGLILNGDIERISNLQLLKWFKSRI